MVTTFAVHQLVKVAQRQWPGVNKEGGDARVLKMNEDGTVAVAYIIGKRSEASVHVKVRSTALPLTDLSGVFSFGCVELWWAPKLGPGYLSAVRNRKQMLHATRANFEL